MASYSKIFGSQFPDSVMELTGFKDIGDAGEYEKAIIQQFYSYMENNDYASASALLESNWNYLKPYYLGMETLNKIEEEIYNTQLYAKKNSVTVVSSSSPSVDESSSNSIWLKPV